MLTNARLLVALLAAPFFVLSVAAEETPKAALVQGSVTFKGQPLNEATIGFHPDKGKAVKAEIKEGTYAAEKVPVGKLRVTIFSPKTPKVYASPETTPLAADIKAGKNALDFDLK